MAAGAGARDGTVTVMSRNLYIGTDIDRIVLAAATAEAEGGSPEQVLVALANAAHRCRQVVEQTSFTVRAGLIAGEIARTRPDLVGLQEVALWRSGPLDLGRVGVPDATVVDHDHLAILLDALAARGLDYRAVLIGERADVEAPAFTGSPADGSVGADARDVRLTVRDVVLARASLGVTADGDAVFRHNLELPVLGTTMQFRRGYQWVDVTTEAGPLRFVNSHLEAFGSDIALAQATELVGTAPADDRPTVVVADINSDPLDGSVRPGDTVPNRAAYDLITGAGGFTDQWLQWAPAAPGWTSGLSELVDDPVAGFDHRIDMVFTRSPVGADLGVVGAEVTGTLVSDRDPVTGLWPSDHGGVVVRLRGV